MNLCQRFGAKLKMCLDTGTTVVPAGQAAVTANDGDWRGDYITFIRNPGTQELLGGNKTKRRHRRKSARHRKKSARHRRKSVRYRKNQ